MSRRDFHPAHDQAWRDVGRYRQTISGVRVVKKIADKVDTRDAKLRFNINGHHVVIEEQFGKLLMYAEDGFINIEWHSPRHLAITVKD